ncbi:MAG: AraC family transcriptional regulator [Oleiphilaceae bacterium]|nr:AraC family transcriptional regulator [Oleiphilaceae bacterium]
MPQQELKNILQLGEADIGDPDVRVSMHCLPKLWEAAYQTTGDAAIGLRIGNEVKPEQLSIIAQALLQSESLHQGLSQYIRFMRLVNEAVSLSLSVGNQEARLDFLIDPAGYHRSEVERTVAAAVARARYAMGDTITVNEVHFAHPNPGYVDVYHDVFRAPVRFDRPVTALIFDKRLLAKGPSKRNPYVYQALVHHAEGLLKKLKPKENTEDALRDYIRTHLAQDQLDVESAAENLHMSRHTLYRKLKKAGLSFQGLVEEVRQQQALSLLQRKEISVSEVAFLLGFSELSAFSRAFKRWTGSSPAQFREHHALAGT